MAHDFGISLVGSRNGIGTTVAARSPCGVVTVTELPEAAEAHTLRLVVPG